MVRAVLSESILGRAIASGAIKAEVIDIRSYSKNKHKNTDDSPYGGGAGMVMLAQPIVDAVNAAAGDGFSGRRIYMSPRGERLTQKNVERLSREDCLIILCGHYEGVDQRAIDLVIDEEISIGDYVLTGGELGALALVDSVSRLIDGVLGCSESKDDESFSSGLLEYPQYTRPREFIGLKVPEVLLNGNLAEVTRWRRDMALAETFERRPDLIDTSSFDKRDFALLRQLKDERKTKLMKKIGFIDYYLDEWHANNYPEWIRQKSEELGLPFEIAYAWEEKQRDGGIDGKAWCEKFGVQLLSSRAEVCEKSDVIVVLAPDNPETHERLAREALMSGKPVYIDKTFAPDAEAAGRLFGLAKEYNTPVCSSSALRCSRNLDNLKGDKGIVHFATTGPGRLDNYAVHQLEMIVSVMGENAKRVMACGTDAAANITIDYGKNRYACMTQSPACDFTCSVAWEDGKGDFIKPVDYFKSFIEDMLKYFAGGDKIAPEAQTIAVMKLLDASKAAMRRQGAWIKIENS